MNATVTSSGTGLISRLIDLFSSIRLGISLIAIIIVYSTIGSAVPPARQFFELTEFQYFNHWVFVALIALFCLNLIVATIRRIRLNTRNLGVLTVHAGLLTLCAGSLWYFGWKIEGDVLLVAPQIRVVSIARLRGDQSPTLASFAVYKDKVWSQTMPMAGGEYDIRVIDVRSSGLNVADAVELEVKVGAEAPKRITLRQPSADGDGSAAVAKLNDHVLLQLAPGNVAEAFYDNQTPCVVLKQRGRGLRYELPELPYYQEIYDARVDLIRDMNGRPMKPVRTWSVPVLEKWHMPIELVAPGSAEQGDIPYDIKIDGYLPYAELSTEPKPGGSMVNTVANLRIGRGGDAVERWLGGIRPGAQQFEAGDLGRVEFRWLTDRDSLDPAWTAPLSGKQVLDVFVKDKNVRKQYEIKSGQVIAVEGTDYTLTIEQLHASWPLMTASHQGARSPTALVWVKSPTREFQRSVLQRYPELNQDRDRSGKKILDTGGLVDDNIELRYADSSTPHVLVAAGPNLSPTVVYTAVGGKRTVRAIAEGKTETFDDGNTLTLTQLIERPVFESTPRVVPENRRRPFSDVRRAQSMIRVCVAPKGGSGWIHRAWVPFSHYNGQLANFSAEDAGPLDINLPDGEQLSVLYGRAERRLPGKVALERLKTDYYPGRNRPSGWESFFRYEDRAEGQVMRTSCWLNNTATVGNWTLFQANAANDGETFTGLGVGNRDGVMVQLLGCIMISLGLVYAFTVKPMLVSGMKRRALEEAARRGHGSDRNGDGNGEAHGRTPPRAVPVGSGRAGAILLAGLLLGVGTARAADAPPMPSHNPVEDLLAKQSQIDTAKLGAIVVQYNSRFSSLEAWARTEVENIVGARGSVMGLDPVVAAMELMFNPKAYTRLPLLYVKDLGLRKHLTSEKIPLPESERKRILREGLISYEFLQSEPVQSVLAPLQGDTRFVKAMNRLMGAESTFERFGSEFLIVPTTAADPSAVWHTMDDLLANVSDKFQLPRNQRGAVVPGVSEKQAEEAVATFMEFGRAWQNRDVAAINAGAAKLQTLLAAFAPPGKYPTESQRTWEVKYYRWRLQWWAWVCYIVAFFFGIFATATRYGWARWSTLGFLAMALLLHGADLGLRWYVIGRIPVANMYEAVVSSTFVGATLAVLIELIWPKRVFALAAGFLGFFALALPEMKVLDLTNRIDTMAPILDDVMLRIHTVLIISSYAVITLAYAVANCYLFAASRRQKSGLAAGVLVAQVGLLTAASAFYAVIEPKTMYFVLLAVSLIATGLVFVYARIGWVLGWTAAPRVALAGAGGGGGPMEFGGMTDGGGATVRTSGLTKSGGGIDILKEFDVCHCVFLYIAMVALFVGIVLGAAWADYSWGRPWGWDPKEVFALNTWLVYAILIHARYTAKDRALWTAVLSVIGFAAMQFNWWVVNFYIVGLHSYA